MRLLPSSLLGLVALGCGASDAFTGGSGSGGATGTTSTMVTTTSTMVTTTSSTMGGGGAAFTSSSSSGSSSASSSGGAGGGTSGSGDCKVDADCPSGECVALTAGGFRVCVAPPTPVTACTGALDQCCPATQHLCAGNAPCYLGPLVPACTGVAMAPYNVCGVDQCAKDVDCGPNQICAPAGTLGLEIRACVNAHCKLDADCTAQPGGLCAPVRDPCCAATAGLFCDYPAHGGCRSNADCPPLPNQPIRYCAPDPVSGVASCQTGGPVCPT